MEEEQIEEASEKLLGSSIGASSEKWVDGSQVDIEPPDWSLFDESGERQDTYGGGLVRRRLFKKHKRVDSFDVEAMEISGAHHHHPEDTCLCTTLALSFQTLGVVMATWVQASPLYVFSDVFNKVRIQSEVDILRALSLVMYTIALIPLAKYVFVVLKANDNGEGLYFLLQILHLLFVGISCDGCIRSRRTKKIAVSFNWISFHSFSLSLVNLLEGNVTFFSHCSPILLPLLIEHQVSRHY